MPTNNLSVPGIVGIAILVILVLAIIVRNIYVVQQCPVPMWWSGWVPSTPCGAWACI